jgi:hypothetical protein
MQPSAVLDQTTVTADLADLETVQSLIAGATGQGGFMLGLDTRPEPFATYTVVLKAPGDFAFSFQARVVQIFDRGEDLMAAFQLEGWSAAREDELKRKLKACEAPEAESEEKGEGEAFGTAPIYRIRAMDPSQKMRLAMKADRAERRILCRDSSPQVLLGLLANPRIEATDVVQIVKSTHASPGVLQRVAKDRRWMSNTEIQTALVRNPKTPTPIAIQLLESVPTNELRAMAKMGSLRENVRRAAFRVYTKRTSRRR